MDITREDLIRILDERDARLERLLDQKFDQKLEPIYNQLQVLATDMQGVKTHVESINNRLFKIEKRLSDAEMRVSKHHGILSDRVEA